MIRLNGIITILTDFGTKDPYAGIMKGIILKINPDARIIDITHEIPDHDIKNASLTIGYAYGYFPKGTIHVAVVDPGVGGDRKNIAVKTANYIFIGPDNGIFSLALSKEKIIEIREIEKFPFVFDKVSNTFHGRDVYAPCAAFLTAGKKFSDIGRVLSDYTKIVYPVPKYKGNSLTGEIVLIDSFGNMVTNISEHSFKSFTGRNPFEIYFASERFTTLDNRYIDVPPGKPLVLFGSSGYLEISMNGKSAAEYFMASEGASVTVRRS